jgi:hypothetical protein
VRAPEGSDACAGMDAPSIESWPPHDAGLGYLPTRKAAVTERYEVQRSINSRIAPSIPSRAWNSTVALVVSDAPAVRHLATATLFQLADVKFAVTAAHAVRRASAAGKTLAISGGTDRHFVTLAGGWMCSGDGSDSDPHDVAVFRIPDDVAPKLANVSCLRLSDITLDEPDPRGAYTLFGYPGVWASSSATDGVPLTVKPLEVTTHAYDGDRSTLPGYDPRLHILLSLGQDDLTSPDGTPLVFTDRMNQPVSLPIGIKGVSGCSVWYIGNLDTPIETWTVRPARLAGVQTTAYRFHQAIRATRWISVTTLINEAFPDLRPVLRLSLL